MPGRNGTGPDGMGPFTGKGLGPCNRSGAVPRFGYRCGLGFGKRGVQRDGLRFGMGVPAQNNDGMAGKEDLLAYKTALENRLSSINKQLDDM